LFKKQHSVEE